MKIGKDRQLLTLLILVFTLTTFWLLFKATILPPKRPEVQQVAPLEGCFNIKVKLTGLPEDKQQRGGVILVAKDSDWQKTITLSASGTFENLDCTGLDPNTTYEFTLYAQPPFLPKTITSRPQGTLDFGTIPTGDLRPDQLWSDSYSEINAIDWSLMEEYFGQKSLGGPKNPIPIPSPTPKEGPGIHLGFVDFPADLVGGEDPVKSLGINWLKNTAPWNVVEPQQGLFSWEKIDKKVLAAQNRGVNLALAIRAKSGWGTIEDCDRTYEQQVSCPPKEISLYTNFVGRLVERYDGDGVDDMSNLTRPVKYWLFENEWDSPVYWGGTTEQLMELLPNAYQAVKAADGEARLVLGGIGSRMLRAILVCEGIIEGEPLKCDDPLYPVYKQRVEEILTKGQNFFDIVDFHQYTDYLEIRPKIDWLRRRVSGKLFWTGEAGGPDLNYHQYSDEEHAKQVVKRYVLAFGNGVDKVFWFLIRDLPSDFPIERSWRYQGLFREDNSKKPGFYTYKLLSSKLEGFSSVERIPSEEGIEIYKFVVNNKPVYVLWDETGSRTVELNVNSSQVLLTNIITQSGQDQPTTETKDSSSGKTSLSLTSTPIFAEEIP